MCQGAIPLPLPLPTTVGRWTVGETVHPEHGGHDLDSQPRTLATLTSPESHPVLSSPGSLSVGAASPCDWRRPACAATAVLPEPADPASSSWVPGTCGRRRGVKPGVLEPENPATSGVSFLLGSQGMFLKRWLQPHTFERTWSLSDFLLQPRTLGWERWPHFLEAEPEAPPSRPVERRSEGRPPPAPASPSPSEK